MTANERKEQNPNSNKTTSFGNVFIEWYYSNDGKKEPAKKDLRSRFHLAKNVAPAFYGREII